MQPLAKILGWGAALLIILGAAALYMHARRAPRGVACPQMALLCPDGSSVSARGELCAFDSCPNSGPLTGELRQVSGGFQLMLAAPTSTTQEVTYALPLQAQDTQGLAALVGKNVTVSGSFAEGNTFVVDHVAPAQNPDATLGEARVGQVVFINGVRISVIGVTNDSRCPVGVQCVRAGSVSVHVALKSDTDFATTTLQSGAAPIGFDAFLVSLIDVQPPRAAGSAPKESDYVLTFKVANTSTVAR